MDGARPPRFHGTYRDVAQHPRRNSSALDVARPSRKASRMTRGSVLAVNATVGSVQVGGGDLEPETPRPPRSKALAAVGECVTSSRRSGSLLLDSPSTKRSPRRGSRNSFELTVQHTPPESCAVP
eukprot:3060025-Prymnesium_polylepis.1